MLQLDYNIGNKKLELIVKTGLQLFWNHGIKRITIEEICREAGVSKNTFYKHFDNKLDLIRMIMNLMYEKGMNDFKKIMNLDISFEEKLEKMLDLKFKAAENMSAHFFKEMYLSGDVEIINMLQEMGRKRQQMITDIFKKAQDNGEIRKDLKLDFIIFLMGKMATMIEDEELLDMFDSPTELIVELTAFYFYGMMPRTKHKE